MADNPKHHAEKFPGFPPEPNQNFWQYPKALNGFWHQLSGSEQKVLDYIVRHTWGWQKATDKISLSQFKNGIKNKKGFWIDRGTGLKHNQTLTNSLKSLEEKGFIVSAKSRGKTTQYTLKVVQSLNSSNSKSEQVGSMGNEHTINNITTNNKQYGTNKNNPPKPYFHGCPMRKSFGSWQVAERGGWVDFVGKEEDIEWRKTR